MGSGGECASLAVSGSMETRPMSITRACPQCGASIPADSPHGICPRCLLNVGLGPRAGGEAMDETSAAPHPRRFTAPKPSLLSAHFPQLEILDLIGHGGMGAVYKARQRGLDRLVAPKILPPDAATDPTFAERFSRESTRRCGAPQPP